MIGFQLGKLLSQFNTKLSVASLEKNPNMPKNTKFFRVDLRDYTNCLKITKKIHVPISTFLGALPGCGGAIIIVTQFVQGRISFGSLVAVLTATMGDAAFLLLSGHPEWGLCSVLL